MAKLLEILNLKKIYGKKGNITHALNGVSFGVEKGEYVAIMGASGSGKTTLLNCISTIDSATSGNISIDNIDVTKIKSKDLAKFRREKLGFIFQEYNLLDTLTARENIALALSILKHPEKNIDKRINKISNKLGITKILEKYPYEISGGQKQRVAAARAVVTNPSLILADEPTGALDSKSAKDLLGTFEKLNKELNSTILMVTHDAFTASYCNRVLFMKDGKIFNELYRGDDTRRMFFEKIIDVISLLGGEIEYDK